MARPKLPEAELRDEIILARVKFDEKEIFDAGCELEGLSPSAMLRQFVLNKNHEWKEKFGKELDKTIKKRKQIREKNTINIVLSKKK
jgi:hypothetical protein